MTKSSLLTLAVLVLCARASSAAPTKPAESPAQADATRDGGIVHGDDWAFLATAPKGWYMSLQSGFPVNAAFFQEAPTEPQVQGKPPTFMYITLSRPELGLETLDQLIAQDEADFRSSSSDLKVIPQPDVLMGDKKPARVRRFENTQGGRTELVAYRVYGKDMYKLVVSAPSPEALTMNTPAFEALLGKFVPAKFELKSQG